MSVLGRSIAPNCAIQAEGVTYVYVGAGVPADTYFSWLDTKGFSMIGLQGIALGVRVFIGLHESERSIRVTMFVANVGLDAVVALRGEGTLETTPLLVIG